MTLCAVWQEAFGFIERADVVKEIFFHYSEFKGDLEALQAGDDVEFTIKERNVGEMSPDQTAVAKATPLVLNDVTRFVKVVSVNCDLL